MHLYNLTLQRPGAINCATWGSFSGPKRNEFIVSRGHMLELLAPHPDTGRLQSLAVAEVFGVVRSLLRFRLHGQEFDHIVVGSDSGRLVVLRYDGAAGAFVRVQLETYGKTGCRRITPGQYVAGDPRGRALMVAAVEKGKLVYLCNREGDALTVSSPLEAHKSHTIVFDVVGVDVGYENPVFACLELEYADADADPTGEAAASAGKSLVYYELDLGLNTVTRKWSRETDRGANALLTVPGGTAGVFGSTAAGAAAASAAASASDGPGGVLVLAENWVVYEHPDQPALRAPIPRRNDMPDERGLLITSATLHRKKAGAFFYLLQSEAGDVYKATLQLDTATGSGRVADVLVQYLDTIPPASALCVSRDGYLFSASEAGDHHLFRIASLGDEEPADTAVVAHAVRIDDASAAAAAAAGGGGDTGETLEVICPAFSPRPLTNIVRVDSLPSLAPITDIKAVLPVPGGGASALAAAAAAITGGAGSGSGASAPFLAALSGRGPRSTLRVLREGLPVTEFAASVLPGAPTAVFTVRVPAEGDASGAAGGDGAAAAGGASASSSTGEDGGPLVDKYIVFSFANGTLTLSVGDSIEETSAKDTGIADGVPTLAITHLANDSLVQVHPGGMRLVTGSGAGKRVQEWRPPGKRTIVRAAANRRQVLLALSGGEIVYFSVDPGTGKLEERVRTTLDSEVVALAVGGVPPGRLGAPLAALADSSNMVRVLSLDPSAPLTQVAAQATKSPVESLLFATLTTGGATTTSATSATTGSGAVASQRRLLFIGLASGVLVRVSVDHVSGALSDPRSRLIGVKPVKLAALAAAGRPAVLALSSRPWIVYGQEGRLVSSPLSTAPMEAAAAFTSPMIPEGFVGVNLASGTGGSGGLDAAGEGGFRLAAVERTGEAFNTAATLPLCYTARRLALLPSDPRLAVVIESDQHTFTAATRAAMALAGGAAGGGDAADAADGGGAALPPPPPPPAAPSAASGDDMDTGMDMEDDDHDDGDVGMGGGASASRAGAATAGAAADASVSARPAAGGVGATGAAADTPGAIAPPLLASPGEDAASVAGVSGFTDPMGEGVDARRVGTPLPGAPGGVWASAVRIVDMGELASLPPDGGYPTTHHASVHHLTELPQDEAALSVCALTFPGAAGTSGGHSPDAVYVLVGTVKGLSYHPRRHAAAAIRTYRLVPVDVPVDAASGRELDPAAAAAAAASGADAVRSRRVLRLQFLHSTPVEEVPYAIAPCGGRALVGVGRTLRLYDLGTKRLLRKAEARGFPTLITSILPVPGCDRFVVGDAAESIHFVRWRRADNALVVFGDDTVPRQITAVAPLDADTVAGGDRFGNVFVLRLPSEASDEVDGVVAAGGAAAGAAGGSASATRLLWEAATTSSAGAPNKLAQVAQFHVGEAITSLQKTTLAGGSECLLYSTVGGAIGALLPFASRDDLSFFTHLELFLRNEALSLVGRDHLSYRSYYIPVKDVIDGDLCEVFSSLPYDKQKAIAGDLERTPAEVLRKIEDIRAKIL